MLKKPPPARILTDGQCRPEDSRQALTVDLPAKGWLVYSQMTERRPNPALPLLRKSRSREIADGIGRAKLDMAIETGIPKRLLKAAQMRIDQTIGEVLSLLLWQHRSIEVRELEPFQLSSGNFTPLYVNCRLLISYPGTRDIITSFAQRLYHERNISADCIAGGETAGIPFGAWLAERVDKPFVYVRKKRKQHGTGSRLEGVAKGEVLLFEDLITDGASKISFIEGIREAGCTVSNCLVVVDREQGGEESLARAGVRLHSLVGISTVLETGCALGLLPSEAHAQVKEYLADPREWHRRRALQFSEQAE